MVQTNTGYMSDPERAERIVRRFTGTRIKEFLTPGNRKWIRFMTDAMIPREGLSEKELQDMEYLQFARLVYSVGANSQYDWFSHDSRTEQLIYFKCLAEALIEGSKVSIPVKMFLELPLKAYYNCLDNVRTIGPLGNHFENLKECFAYKEGYTLRDCLREKLNEIRKAWTMCIPLEQYREDIEDAHAISDGSSFGTSGLHIQAERMISVRWNMWMIRLIMTKEPFINNFAVGGE